MTGLPIEEVLPGVLDALASHGCCVVVAPPGSGKTTRVPPAILQAGLAGDGQLLLLQPRRVAARACARFLAQEHGTPLGDHVGFAIRMERKASSRTRLLVVTEGVLTRRLQDDPFLEGVGCVVLDEFHERSLHGDLGLALLREIRSEARPDLKVVVMSATLDPGPISGFLNDAPVETSDGRQHGVDVRYLEAPDDRPVAAQVASGVRRALREADGDVLAFLPGAGEIARCIEALADTEEADVLPLHGDLPADAQDRALRAGRRRRVILATNVAETSLTIEGIGVVVDAGLVRQLRHDPRIGVDRLELRRVSRASADQRAGRAGRLGPGIALRLWTRAKHRELEDRDPPEIRRIDLASAVLELKAWGVDDPMAFPWFEAPSEADVTRAVEMLTTIGALHPDGAGLTATGQELLALPLPPRIGRLLVEARRLGVERDGARVCAMLSERDVLRSARAFHDGGPPHPTGPSDVLLRLDLIEADDPDVDRRVARRLARVARNLLRGEGSRDTARDRDVALRRAVLSAFPDRVARRRAPGSREAVMVGGRGLLLDERSVVREATLFVAVDLEAGRRGHGSKSRVRIASAVEPDWLELETTVDVGFDRDAEKVVAVSRTRYRDLVVGERPGGDVDPVRAEAILAEAVRVQPDRALAINEGLAAWLTRVRCLREWRPELALPLFDDEALVDALVTLCPGRRSFAELHRAPLGDVLRGSLSHEQTQAIAREAPETIELSTGRRARLRYEAGRPPVVSAQVQHLFGVLETPTVAAGRVPVLVELLAPNRRPVQLTQDLASFWRTTYAQVRKDLRGRYPKHAWPEVPPGLEE